MVHHISCVGLKRTTQHHLFHMTAPHMTIGSSVHKRSILAHAVPTVPQHHLFHMTAICCSCNCHRIDKLEGRVAKLEHENAKLVDVLIQALSAPSSPATEDTVPPRTAASFKLPAAQYTHMFLVQPVTIRSTHMLPPPSPGCVVRATNPAAPTSPSVVDDKRLWPYEHHPQAVDPTDQGNFAVQGFTVACFDGSKEPAVLSHSGTR